jgi:hypothetical protein
LSPSSIHKVHFHICVCFQLCDKFHDHTFIHMVSPFFFVASFHNLEIAGATFMEDFLGRKWPKVRFWGKEVFLLSQNFFFEEIKWGCLIHVPCAKNLSYSIYHRTWTWF